MYLLVCNSTFTTHTHTHTHTHIVQELFDGSYEGRSPHYALNIINQKITFPLDDNFSDDELAFLPYFVYFHTLKVSWWVSFGLFLLTLSLSLPLSFCSIWSHSTNSTNTSPSWCQTWSIMPVWVFSSRGRQWGGRGAVHGVPSMLMQQVKGGLRRLQLQTTGFHFRSRCQV